MLEPYAHSLQFLAFANTETDPGAWGRTGWHLYLPPLPSRAAAAKQRVSVRGASAPPCPAFCQTTAFQKLSALKLHGSYGSAGLTVTFCHSCQRRSRRDERKRGPDGKELAALRAPAFAVLPWGRRGISAFFHRRSFQTTSKFNLF